MILRYDQGMNTPNETPDHPLTETAAAELWDTHAADTVPWDDWYGGSRRALTAMLRAAFDAGREHERTNPDDPRPWEPLAPGDPLHAGDEVWRWWCGVSTRGTFDVQHPDSQVYTAERGHLGHRAIGTWCVRRRIPAPTPPAEEVELPSEPCVLTDVQLRDGVALWTDLVAVATGFNRRAVTIPNNDLAAFTLPDGTRARRDGEHEDGTPRFVEDDQ